MDLEFILSVLTIIGVDIVLGGDNAIVVALACRNLPKELRNKAMVLGILLAIIIRMGLTVVAVHLLSIPFLLAIGGGLLTFIAFQLLLNSHDDPKIKGSTSLLAAIKIIIFADCIMGFDNVIAVAGAAHGNTLLVIIGLLVSVPIILWGSKLILKAFDVYPQIIYVGAGILAFTASKMIIHEPMLAPLFIHAPTFKLVFQISLIIGVLIGGWIIKSRQEISV
ncbi:TerC family protein [Alkalihalobacillus trypoxylicola]|uniref:TerC family protein n=1 Tax=Alkalihalobacillus trypoxylicola TaxID=519424 RepID=A0A162EEZ7_9BACI|nr:TerC family protein [Alkalihalobacillus trypoxylicola]KYG32413.1 hypothetical protein AZF04_06535 [Alkalihalobacillus trypoxylicola]